MDVQYSAFKKTINQHLPRQVSDEEKASIACFSLLSERHHAELNGFVSHTIVALSYLSYILTPEMAAHASTYIYEVLIDGRLPSEEFMQRTGLMKITLNDIPRRIVDGQDLYLPNFMIWRQLLAFGHLSEMSFSNLDWIKRWLGEYGQFPVAVLALHRHSHDTKWSLIPLLQLNGEYLRAHYEDVICEHCHSRCGASATPDSTLYPSSASAAIYAKLALIPVKDCPHCGGKLLQRQTRWLAKEEI